MRSSMPDMESAMHRLIIEQINELDEKVLKIEKDVAELEQKEQKNRATLLGRVMDFYRILLDALLIVIAAKVLTGR